MGLKRGAVALFAVGILAGTAMAHEGAMGVVKERMDAMSAIGDQMKVIGQMLKGGSVEETKLSAAAGTIADHGGEALTKLFPDGSLDKPTEATAAIWTDWPKFEALAGDLQASALTLKDLADDGAGNKELSTAFGTLAGTCKECHADFREKK